jgi:hypothetical protein
LEVDIEGIRKGEFRWEVPVHPDFEPVKRYEYYEALVDVEDAMEDRENLKVLLIPSDPTETKAA